MPQDDALDFDAVSRSRSNLRLDYLCVAIILIGSVLRAYVWMLNRGLWLDESYLAVSILERHFTDLHKPLEYGQSAPWLFLVASKCMVMVFGPSELVLRSLALATSIASLWLFWLLAKECLRAGAVPVALTIFTFAVPPIYYAQEFKQYSVDIFFTTFFLWLAARMFASPKTANRFFVAIALTGCIGIFFMHAMPFLLGGFGVALLWARQRRFLTLSYARMWAIFAIWVALFLVNYIIIILPNYTDSEMLYTWSFAYPKMPWSIAGLRTWYALIGEYLSYIGYVHIFKAIVGLFIVLGVWYAITRRRLALVAAGAAAGLYWLAALAGRAPFYERLVLFLFPLVPLFIGCGLSQLAATRRRAIMICGIAAVLFPTVRALPHTIQPHAADDPRESILRLAEWRHPSEAVYLLFW
jgi:hypothetical protein